MKPIDHILNALAELIRLNKFDEVETEWLELKSVPAQDGEWKELYKTCNAFLNTRGGIVVLGVKEEGTGPSRRYVFTGWKPHAEPNLKEIQRQFTDRRGVAQDVTDRFPPMELHDFLSGRVAVLYVDALPADRKFVFHKGVAYKRLLTGDHKIGDAEIAAQEEYKEEAATARELQPVSGLTLADLDIEKLNHFIYQLNQPVSIETIKPDLAQALPFLKRRLFVKDETVTVLGALVCAKHPGACLGFRSQVHGYVDVPQAPGNLDDSAQIVRDKQDFVDNVLQLMESGLGYLMRNIQVGVGAKDGGVSQPQYPTALLRETVNNALAHRDYALDRQVILAIKPGVHIAIQNPGAFRKQLLIEAPDDAIPLRRILPEAKPRNPKLADVLRVYRKWEGRGIGMATLVNLCLQNQLDLPYYRLLSEEVRLYLCAGRLLDERMERLFQSFDGYIETRMQGNALTAEQKLVLSYLIKSEWANEQHNYTIILTPDNNHFNALLELERAQLIRKHAKSTPNYPVYLADRVLLSRGYLAELREIFGSGIDSLDPLLKQVLGVVYRLNHYSKSKDVSAKQASFSLWYEQGNVSGGIEQFDAFYRKVRRAFNALQKQGRIERIPNKQNPKTYRYQLNRNYLKTHLL